MEFLEWVLIAVYGFLLVFYPFYLLLFAVEKIRARRQKRSSRMAWSTFVFYLVVVTGIVAPVYHAMTSFPHGDRSNRAKTNLGAIWTGQTAYHGEFNTYGQTFEQIAWAPEGQARYSYYLVDDFIPCDNPEWNCGPQIPFQTSWNLPVTPLVTRESFVCLAIGNIDADTAWDIWMINEKRELVRIYDDERNEYGYEFVKDQLSWLEKLGRGLDRTPEIATFLFFVLAAVSFIVCSPLLFWCLHRDLYNLFHRKAK